MSLFTELPLKPLPGISVNKARNLNQRKHIHLRPLGASSSTFLNLALTDP